MAKPHGKPYYIARASIAGLSGAMFSWGVFAAASSTGQRLICAVVGTILWLATLQACERLFRPERATERARCLSDRTRAWVKTASTATAAASLASAVIAAVAPFLRGSARDMATDALELSALLLFALSCLADFAGEPLPLTWAKAAGSTPPGSSADRG